MEQPPPRRVSAIMSIAGVAAVLAVLLPGGFVGRAESTHAVMAALATAVGLLFTAGVLFTAGRGRDGSATARALGAAFLLPGPVALAWGAMQAPLFTASRQYAGSPGPAVAAFVAWVQLIFLVGCGSLAIVALVLFVTVGRRVGDRIVGSVPPSLLATVATLIGGGLVVVVGATLWSARGLPSIDVYLERLPIVAEAPKADSYEVDAGSSVPRLVPRASDYHTEYCRVGGFRQRSDRPCSGAVLRYDARARSWLVEARTSAGLEPLVWCQRDPTVCPDLVAPCSLAGSVGPPRIWVASAVAGALLTLLLLASSFGRNWKAGYPARACLAAGCIALTSAPLVVYQAASAPCPVAAEAMP